MAGIASDGLGLRKRVEHGRPFPDIRLPDADGAVQGSGIGPLSRRPDRQMHRRQRGRAARFPGGRHRTGGLRRAPGRRVGRLRHDRSRCGAPQSLRALPLASPHTARRRRQHPPGGDPVRHAGCAQDRRLGHPGGGCPGRRHRGQPRPHPCPVRGLPPAGPAHRRGRHRLAARPVDRPPRQGRQLPHGDAHGRAQPRQALQPYRLPERRWSPSCATAAWPVST